MNESLMKPTQRSIPVQKRALEKYELILKASCELLEERGFAGMSTREISRRAGCNIATVYRYFDGVNDIVKALGEPFFSGISELFNQMSSLLIQGGSLESAIQLFVEALTQELKENRWALYAEAGIMGDRDLITWDQQFLEKIESRLSGVLSIALPEKSPGELQVISFRLVRHWKNYMRILIEYDERQDTSWLAKDMVQTSMALIETKIV